MHYSFCFLNDIAEAYHRAPGLSHLLLDEHFGREVMEALPAWKKYIGVMLREGLPVPVLSAALNYFLGLTTNRSPANMIQAMRDYFGAHTFERVDSPRGNFSTNIGKTTIDMSQHKALYIHF